MEECSPPSSYELAHRGPVCGARVSKRAVTLHDRRYRFPCSFCHPAIEGQLFRPDEYVGNRDRFQEGNSLVAYLAACTLHGIQV